MPDDHTPWRWRFYIIVGLIVFAGLIHMGPGIIKGMLL